MLVAEGHVICPRHVHQAAGLVLDNGGGAMRPVHDVIEAEQRLRARGRSLNGDVTHQVDQIGRGDGTGGRARGGVPYVHQAVRHRAPGGGVGVAGLRGDALDRSWGRGVGPGGRGL